MFLICCLWVDSKGICFLFRFFVVPPPCSWIQIINLLNQFPIPETDLSPTLSLSRFFFLFFHHVIFTCHVIYSQLIAPIFWMQNNRQACFSWAIYVTSALFVLCSETLTSSKKSLNIAAVYPQKLDLSFVTL